MAAYNPKDRTSLSKTIYAVSTTGDAWFHATTGYGDNPNSGTMTQRLERCTNATTNNGGVVGFKTGTTQMGVEAVV